jgi:hypothetical protein
MGDTHGGDPERLLQRLDLVAHLLADPGVEIGQRLVEQQDLRIDGQRAALGPGGRARSCRAAPATSGSHGGNENR